MFENALDTYYGWIDYLGHIYVCTMIKEWEEQKQARKLAKKEKRRAGRKKRLKAWGIVLLCVAVFVGAGIWGIVKYAQSVSGTLGEYEDLIDALSETVNIEEIAPDAITSADYTSFISECETAGVNILINDELNDGELTLTSALTLSGNEFGAYVNEAMAGEDNVFELLEVSLYRVEDSSNPDGYTDYIKTVCKINVSQINEELGSTAGAPSVLYLTTTSEVYKYRNQLLIVNNQNRINQLDDDKNEIIFNAIMSDEFEEVDGIMNSVLIEEVNSFITHSGATLSYNIENDEIQLVFSPSD